jgi:chromosome segregation ATPase
MTFKTLDQTTKKWLLLFLACLFSWWLFSAQATCSASGTPEPEKQTVTVEIAELDRLDSIFNQQQQINGKLLNELTDSKTALLKSQTELQKAQRELRMLQLQIAELKSLSESQESLLQKANKSFEEYAAEQKKTRLRVKAQRNTWEAIAACLVIALAVK